MQQKFREDTNNFLNGSATKDRTPLLPSPPLPSNIGGLNLVSFILSLSYEISFCDH